MQFLLVVSLAAVLMAAGLRSVVRRQRRSGAMRELHAENNAFKRFIFGASEILGVGEEMAMENERERVGAGEGGGE